MNNDVLTSQIPSVFVIDSPFQVLCAVAAIRQLQIKDYKMIAVVTDNKKRNQTIRKTLDFFHILFTTVKFDAIHYKYYQLYAMMHRKHGYHRVFIGFYDAPFHHTIGCCYASDGAEIVYLDDGAANINLLQHKSITSISDFHPKEWLQRLAVRRGIELYKNLLTIYNDIPNPAYNIAPLNFNAIFCGIKYGVPKDIFIVGTHSESYLSHFGMSKTEFVVMHDQLFARLKNDYSNQNVVFIPHRSDSGEYAVELCSKYGFEYRPVEMTIEMELIQCSNAPKAVFGFTSSALFNLKKLYPNTKVVNVLFQSKVPTDHYRNFLTISAYYEQNGIECLKI